MDFRDTSIITQVAFKGTVDLCHDIDCSTPQGQAEFVQVFSFLTDALMEGVRGQQEPAQQAAQIIQGNFPGAQVVSGGQTGGSYTPPDQQYIPQPQQQPQYVQQPQFNGMPTAVSVKGTQHGELPPWLFEQAAAKGVTEVYDNRDRAQNTKRPWFRSTTGGDNAPAFWPPR